MRLGTRTILFWSALICAPTFLVPAMSVLAQATEAPAAGRACGSVRNDNPVIAAFRDSGTMRDEIAKVTSDDWESGCIFVVRTGGGCGVAGCSSTFLVGQDFTTKGVNPQSITVLAEVHSDPRDTTRISSPRLVKIAPADAIIAPRAWSLLCSSSERPGSETTAGQRICLEEKVKSHQGWLDGMLRKARATMSPDGHPLDPAWSEKRLALFEQSQKAWEAYRAAACDAAYHETFPGSFAQLERLDCLYSVTGVRVGELMSVYFSER